MARATDHSSGKIPQHKDQATTHPPCQLLRSATHTPCPSRLPRINTRHWWGPPIVCPQLSKLFRAEGPPRLECAQQGTQGSTRQDALEQWQQCVDVLWHKLI